MREQSKSCDYEQSSVIPFRVRNGSIELLLITSWGKGAWGFPKGLIEPGMSPAESALKEAREEAGALGRVVSGPVASYRYRKWGGLCHVEVYLMQVTGMLGRWDEADVRRRAWVPLAGADQFIMRRRLRRVLEAAWPELNRVGGIDAESD